MQNKVKDEEPLNVYPFPINIDESVYFSVNGPYEKAVLSVDDSPLSVCTEGAKLDFFGGKPFHAALAQRCRPYVTIYTREKDIPSLQLECAGKRLTWQNLGPIHEEEVEAKTESGVVKKLTLVYTRDRCGYKA